MTGQAQQFIPIDIYQLILRQNEVIERMEILLNNREYRVQEACKRMNISKGTIYKIMGNGMLDFHNGEGGRRISEQHIQEYFNKIDSSKL